MTLFGRQNLVFARAQEFNKPRGFCGIAPLSHRILRVLLLNGGFDGLEDVLVRAGFFEDVSGASFHCPNCGWNVAVPCRDYERWHTPALLSTT